MPVIHLHTYRGKSDETLRGVIEAAHDALVRDFGMPEGDRFEVIHQYERNEFFFEENFRGGPRTDNFLLIDITDRDRTDEQKRRFYKTLVRLIEANTGISPEEVMVNLHSSPPVNFSFAGGRSGLEVIATEALDREASLTGRRSAYTNDEIIDAVTKMFKGDRSSFVSMLGDDFVLKVPATLPYGGEYVGAKAFDDFYGSMNAGDFWASFETNVEKVLDAGDHLIAPITITAVGKTSGTRMLAENLWLISLSGGNVVSAQIYADTAKGAAAAG